MKKIMRIEPKIIRNTTYNILGLGLPFLAAMGTIPLLVATLGESRFGILTLIWAVVSYFGVFDLGLGRAVTQQVAVAAAEGNDLRIKAIVSTSSILLIGFGTLGGIVMASTAPWLSSQFVQSSNSGEVVRAFLWMAVAMPAIVLTSGYRGVLEAMGRFGLVNAIRFPMGLFTFVGPLAPVLLGHAQLDVISAVLSIGRILACVVHRYYALKSIQGTGGFADINRNLLWQLLSMGGWISVSNIISPLMNYVDRFVLSLTISAAAVAYYATPQELILRVGIIPAAIASVLFPIFAARNNRDNSNISHILKYSIIILVPLLPLTILILLMADQLLSWWISPEFANQSARILQIMSIAALASGLAQVPFTMLQGRGRADLTAKLHVAEFPLYLVLLYLLVMRFGTIGAAWAWLLRIILDLMALWLMCLKPNDEIPRRRDPDGE